MTITTSNESASAWTRFLRRFNTFMDVLEMDIHDYQDLRIANIEKRLTKLEAATTASRTPAVSKTEV